MKLHLRNKIIHTSRRYWIGALFLALCMSFPLAVFGSDAHTNLTGKHYVCELESKYDIATAELRNDGKTYGTFFLSGDVTDIFQNSGYPAYKVDGSTLKCYYNYSDTMLNTADDNWHVVSDKSKVANGVDLGDSIGKGVLIIQTSKDGTKWVDNTIVSDFFADKPVNSDAIFDVTNVQLENGCYFKVTVAYKLAKLESSKKILVINKKDYTYEEHVEEYSFFVCSSASQNETDENNRKSLGEKVNTGDKDNGYSGSQIIDDHDPHQGWNLGSFYVSGYTKDTVYPLNDPNGDIIFLKNVGDQIKFGFHLEQDIDRLNDIDGLTIHNEKKAYDQDFEIGKSAFGRGALIVKYTDSNNQSRTVTYFNFLEADASPNADTQIDLFEEGDYEVSLDYTIKAEKKITFAKFADYSHYKIKIKFSVRNGNCMVFLRDAISGKELNNTAYTDGGFVVDFANSKYLSVNVHKSVLMQGENGWAEDVRFNRPAKDQTVFSEDGIYTITVKNVYTGQETEKKIVVGDDKYSKAYIISGLTIEELSNQIKNGATVSEDGTISLVDSTVSNDTNKPAADDVVSSIEVLKLIVPFVLVVLIIIYFAKRRKHRKNYEENND